MKKNSFWILKFSIFMTMIAAMHPWFLWGVDKSYFSFIIVIVIFISLLFSKKIFEFNSYKAWPIFLLFISAILYSKGLEIKGYVAIIVSFVPYMILVFFKKQINVAILSFCTKGFSIVLLPSIIAYLFSYVISLPSLGEFIHPASEKYIFDNYFFFIDFNSFPEFTLRRFSSIFLEPGYLGTCCALLLFANNFNFKKRENKIILIALLFSLSLAGISTFLLGLIFNELLTSKTIKSKVRFVFTVVMVFSVVFYFAQEYNGGDNAINLALFDRLEQDSEKGIKGNNRITESTDDEFKQFLSTDLFWFGVDRTKFKSDIEDDLIQGAGYTIYLIQNGLVSVLVFFLFYLSIAAKSVDKIKSFFFLFLIIITFLQAAYPESGSWLIPFILGISNFDWEKKLNINNLKKNKVPTRQIILI